MANARSAEEDLETCSPWQLIGMLSESADAISRAIPTWGRSINVAEVRKLCDRHVTLTRALSLSLVENMGKWRG
jgi:hypothetical protein